MIMKKIIIGTAGWRMEYGNSHTILSKEEILALIEYLKSRNIFSFDTASNYGDVEKILFAVSGKKTLIDTKLSSFSNLDEFQILLNKKFEFPIQCLYFHDPEIFKKFSSENIKVFIKSIRQNGFSAGFSIYNKDELLENFQFFKTADNKVQLPAHIFDLTAINEVLKLKLNTENVNFRSFFARGLFFLSSDEIEGILGNKYYEVRMGFEEVYKMPFTPENAQSLSYGLINYLTNLNFGCVVGLNSIKEVNSFIKKCEYEKKRNIDWKRIISCSKKLIDIQEINL
mgnify:CR=1 FL=1